MSEEERKWFYHAMESLVEDEGERLKQDMLVLAQKQCPENIDRQNETMEDVEDLVSQIDLAKTFVKLEGMAILLKVANNRPPTTSSDEAFRAKLNRLRAAALTTTATCISHNAEAQADFLKRGGIENMTKILVERREDAKVKAKAVSAISATIRHNPKALLQFLYAAGLDIILLALKGVVGENNNVSSLDQSQLVFLRKSFRLLEYVARESRQKFERSIPQVRDSCVVNAPELVASCLGSGDMEVRESSLAFLSECVSHDPRVMAEIVRSHTRLMTELNAVAAKDDGPPEVRETFLDEIELAKGVLAQL
jgi:hypothetical protein